MSVRAEFIVNTGSFQHVQVTIEADSAEDLERNLALFSDPVKAQLGIFQAELESWVKQAREDALSGPHEAAVAVVQEALGASVESVENEAQAAVQTAATASGAAWNRKVESKPKAWDPKPTAEQKEDDLAGF